MGERNTTWPQELAWAAGFYDGEGCTGIWRRGANGWPCIVVKVGQVDPSSLHRMKAAFGCGSVTGPFVRSKYNPRSKPIHQFNISNFEQAQAAIAMMWKWLGVPKREQATGRLRAVAEWEAARGDFGKARSARSRRVTGERSCAKSGHPKPNKGRCLECQKSRQSSPEYMAWAREYQRKRRAKAALEGA